jgi:hypothetical protein
MFWNGFMRFFTEGYLDFCMLSLLNLKSLDWSNEIPAVTASNYIAITLTAIVCMLPVFILVFYMFKIKQWNTEEFQQRWGGQIESVDTNRFEN